jgi:hypothetical protein
MLRWLLLAAFPIDEVLVGHRKVISTTAVGPVSFLFQDIDPKSR